MSNYIIDVLAKLVNGKTSIQKDLDEIKGLSVNIDNVKLDKNAIEVIKAKIKNADIETNINIKNTSNLEKQAQQMGQQVGKAMNDGINRVIKSSDLKPNFKFNEGDINKVAKEAEKHYRSLSKVVTIQEKLGNNNNLESFIVSLKNAEGVSEKLRYELDQAGKAFVYRGGSVNDNGVITQINASSKAFSDYSAKFADFKSKNANLLSGLTSELADFETKLNGLKTGATSVDEVTKSYNTLKSATSGITSNLSRQLNEVDSAIRHISKGGETIASLKAEFNGLNSTPKEINSELARTLKLLENIKNIESTEGRNANWSKAYSEYANAVDNLRAKLTRLKKEEANSSSSITYNTSDLKKNNILYMSKVYNTIESQLKEIQKLSNANGWQNFEVKGIEQYNGKIKSLTLTITDAEGALKKLNFQREKLQGKGKAQAGLMQVGDVQVVKTASKNMEEMAVATQRESTAMSDLQTKINTQRNSLEAYLGTLKNNSVVSDELKTKLSGMADSLSKVGNKEELNSWILKLREVKSEVDAINKNSTITISAEKAKTEIAKLNNYLIKNSAIAKSAKVQIRAWIDEYRKGTVASDRLRQINADFRILDSKMREQGNLGSSLFDGMAAQAKKFVQWFGITRMVMTGVRMLRTGVQTVIDLDTALVDLKKTTTASTAELENFYNSANDIAKRLGATTQEVINQASAWSRLGLTK